MSQFDVKMTELADAIKAKNNNITGQLSVQGMIDAVDGIVINPPSGEGADVQAVKLYECTNIYHNSWAGKELVWNNEKTAEYPTFKLDIPTNERAWYTKTLEGITFSGWATYTQGVSAMFQPNDVSAIKSNRVFVASPQVSIPRIHVKIAERVYTPDEEGNKPATPTDVHYKELFLVQYDSTLTGKNRVFISDRNSTGEWGNKSELIRWFDATDETRAGWYFTYYGLFYTSGKSGIIGFFLTDEDDIYNFSGFAEHGVMLEVNLEHGPSHDGSTVDYDVSIDEIIDISNNVFPSYVKYISNNLGIGWALIKANGAIEKLVNLPITASVDDITSAFSDYKAASAAYSYISPGWDYTGVLAKDLSITGYTPNVGTAYLPDTTAQATLYPVTPPEYYKCASYDNGETIPAYANINVSGLTSPAEANGTYFLQDVTSMGVDRIWVHGDYALTENDGFWYIYNTSAAPSKMTSVYYAPALIATTSDGTAENPVYWDDAITDTANRWITPTFTTANYASSGYRRNFYVKLVAGTPYQMGLTNPDGQDNIITLYDLNGKSLVNADDNSLEINGTVFSDAFQYTPSISGLYRLEAGSLSEYSTGNTQVCCYPPPEAAHAPTATEPWDIEWSLGGAKDGANIILNAGSHVVNGEYVADGEPQSENTVWTNTSTGAVIKASISSDGDWSWRIYANSPSETALYSASWTSEWRHPWDVPSSAWSIVRGELPPPTLTYGTGQATGNINLTRYDVAERPATGVKVWTGYRATQIVDSKKWLISETETSGLIVSGFEPAIGRIYTADTTVMVASMDMQVEGEMLCLAHFDSANTTFVDGTQTCIIQCQGQSGIDTNIVKFGSGSWSGNYRNPPYEGGFNIIGLPEIAGDFTVEFWHYFSGYDEFGGTILYTYTSDGMGGTEDNSIVELQGINLKPTHPLYRKNVWFHRAFVREGTIVTEYINGHKVATSEFSVALGGSRFLAVYGGGTNVGDVRNNIDEFAIFNYAKYSKNFVPPFVPYEDVKSGLRGNDLTTGTVSVSGCKTIIFANGKSYKLVDSSATGSSRVWADERGEWFIVFDNWMDSTWQITNSLDWEYANRIVAAYIPNDDMVDMSSIEPIGNTKWVDYYDSSVKVNIKGLSVEE